MFEQKYLVELLPYSQDCLLFDFSVRERVISILNYILSTMLDAVNNFEEKNFLKFDPHVGENLCQIRAAQLIDVQEKLKATDLNNIRHNLVKSIMHISAITKEDLEKVFENETKYTLFIFLEKLKINPRILSIGHYLFLCYFLTRFREFNENENAVINYKKLISELGVSKNLSRKIIHEYQKKLSLMSTQYIEEIWENEGFDPFLLSSVRKVDDDGRYVYPCFLVMETLFHRLIKKNRDIFFIIRTDVNLEKKLICMRFIFNNEKGQYEFSEKHSFEEKESLAFIVHGITSSALNTEMKIQEFVNFFKNKNIYQIIMAGMADHPQYSGKKLSSIKEGSFSDIRFNEFRLKFFDMKLFSQKFGCSSKDSRTLFIRHIFFDYISNQLKCMEQGFFYSDSIVNSKKEEYFFD